MHPLHRIHEDISYMNYNSWLYGYGTKLCTQLLTYVFNCFHHSPLSSLILTHTDHIVQPPMFPSVAFLLLDDITEPDVSLKHSCHNPKKSCKMV